MGAGVSHILACFYSSYFYLLIISSQLLTYLCRRRMRRMSALTEAMDGGSGGGQKQRSGSGVSYDVLSTLFNLDISNYSLPILHQFRQGTDEEDKHTSAGWRR